MNSLKTVFDLVNSLILRLSLLKNISLYLIMFFLSLTSHYYFAYQANICKFENKGIFVALVYVFLFFSFVLYLQLIRCVSDIKAKYLLFTCFLFWCIFVFFPPVYSIDLLTYVVHGKMITDFNLNPYKTHTEVLIGTPMYSELKLLGWSAVHGPTPYGVLWTLIERIIASFGFSVYFSCVLFKCLNLILVILFYLFFRKNHTHQIETKLALIMLNPYVIFEIAIDGHNDFIFSLMALTFIIFAGTYKLITAIIFLWGSVFIKHISLFFSPILFFKFKNSNILRLVQIFILLVYIWVVLESPWSPVKGISDHFIYEDWISIGRKVLGFFVILFVIVNYRLKNLQISVILILFIYTLMCSPSLWPWYFIPVIIILIYFGFSDFSREIVLISFGMGVVAPTFEILKDYLGYFGPSVRMVQQACQVYVLLVILLLGTGKKCIQKLDAKT